MADKTADTAENTETKAPEETEKKTNEMPKLKYGYLVGIGLDGKLNFRLVGETQLIHLRSLHDAAERLISGEMELTEPSPMFMAIGKLAELTQVVAQSVAAMGNTMEELRDFIVGNNEEALEDDQEVDGDTAEEGTDGASTEDSGD